jgi:hypothetical protein
VISVDSKKKEVLGNLANKGREYEHIGEPARVDVHDFPDPKLGKAVPSGGGNRWASPPTPTPPGY